MKGGGDGGRRYRSGFGGTPRQKRVLWLRYPKPAGRDSDCLVLGSQESHGLCVRARVGERVFTRLRACLCPRLSLFARYWQVLERAHSHRSRTPTTPAHILQYTRSHKLSLSLSLSLPPPPPSLTHKLSLTHQQYSNRAQTTPPAPRPAGPANLRLLPSHPQQDLRHAPAQRALMRLSAWSFASAVH